MVIIYPKNSNPNPVIEVILKIQEQTHAVAREMMPEQDLNTEIASVQKELEERSIAQERGRKKVRV